MTSLEGRGASSRGAGPAMRMAARMRAIEQSCQRLRIASAPVHSVGWKRDKDMEVCVDEKHELTLWP